jgi:hypothetical protein
VNCAWTVIDAVNKAAALVANSVRLMMLLQFFVFM